MSDENWISRKVNQIEGTLDFKWIKVLKGLNIGNRALFKGHNDILHEDVLESRILADGSLYTKKLIKKPLGSVQFLDPYLSVLGVNLPTTTNVMEESVVNPDLEASWQLSRNIKGKLYAGYEERQWLELSERAVYLCNNDHTYFTKKVDCRSYVNGRLSWLGIPGMMTGKGSARWEQRSGRQIERLIAEIEQNQNPAASTVNVTVPVSDQI